MPLPHSVSAAFPAGVGPAVWGVGFGPLGCVPVVSDDRKTNVTTGRELDFIALQSAFFLGGGEFRHGTFEP